MKFKEWLNEGDILPIEVSSDGKITGYLTSDQLKKHYNIPNSSKRFLQDLLVQVNNENKKQGDKTRVSQVLTKNKIGSKASSVPYK